MNTAFSKISNMTFILPKSIQYFLFITFFPLFLFSSQTISIDSENPLTASAQVIPQEIEMDQIAQLEISLNLPPHFKAYEEQFELKAKNPEGLKISSLTLSPIQEVFDKVSKKTRRVLMGKGTLKAIVSFEGIDFKNSKVAQDQSLELNLRYQACSETFCLFPKTIPLVVNYKIKNAPAPSKTDTGFVLPMSFSEAQSKGLIWTFLFIFTFGFLTSFTPCVYPMIPITMAILGKEAHVRNRWQNFLVSFVYVSGIGATFSTLGVFAATTGVLFGSFMASPWVLGFIVLVFFLMSLSMFGFMELQAPEFIRDGVLSKLKLHGYAGAFASGLIAGVIASPCVGPVLVGILTYIAQTKNIFMGFWLMFTYALGMGLIFLAIGVSTNLTKLLPRSGSWMNRVKYFFGSLLLIASLYYLDLLLVSQKIISQSFLTQIEEKIKGHSTRETPQGDPISWQPFSEEILAQAVKEQKPVIIDFRADWCAACLELEEKTFSSPDVQKLSHTFVMVKFDATQESPELDELRKKFRIIGLPTLVFLTPQGVWNQELTLTSFEEPQPFLERMQKAIK